MNICFGQCQLREEGYAPWRTGTEILKRGNLSLSEVSARWEGATGCLGSVCAKKLGSVCALRDSKTQEVAGVLEGIWQENHLY